MRSCDLCDTGSCVYDMRMKCCELRYLRSEYELKIRNKERFADSLRAMKQRGEQLTAMINTGESP